MGRILTVLVLIVLAVAVLGYHQGWFTVSKAETQSSMDVNVRVDKEKMREDKERTKEQIQRFTGQIKEKAAGTSARR